MGIDGAWINDILPTFLAIDGGVPWLDRLLPAAAADDGEGKVMVIDDFSLYLFRIMASKTAVDTGYDVAQRVSEHIILYIRPLSRVSQYVVMMDEREFTPSSKIPTQHARAESERRRGNIPWSKADVEKMNIKISDGRLPDKKRVMITTATRHDLFRYVTEAICTMDLSCGSAEKNSWPDIIVDGGRRVESTIDQDDYVISQGRIFTYRYRASAATVGAHNPCQSEPSLRIGESDVKAVWHIHAVVRRGPPFPATIVVRSCDGDMIPILLLNMRDWISPTERRVPFRLLLDMSRGSDEKPRILDMVALWRRLILSFKKRFPDTRYPIETFSFLTILSGSDFVKNYPGMGAKTAWRFFSECGGHRLIENGSQDVPSTHPMFRVENETIGLGQKASARRIQLEENTYRRYILRHYQEASSGTGTLKTMRRYCSQIPNDSQILAQSRRTYWNMDYWINCPRHYMIDPLEKHEQSGASVWGWESHVDYTTDPHGITIDVCQSVHVYRPH